MVKSALVHALALTCAVAVQGASIVGSEGHGCDSARTPHCQTSGGSPLSSDCKAALDQHLNPKDNCYQKNGGGSHCTTVASYGSCKVDVCGPLDAHTDEYVCFNSLYDLMNGCTDVRANRLGGYMDLGSCYAKVALTGVSGYRVQFAHT
ncbi:hypothetical protein C8Q80DRAFT_1274051 [Daedaleopsis nitida]|nr:hypothetical protein C8Q80DRAFT_1274051 [Daedaleopsis nitida]